MSRYLSILVVFLCVNLMSNIHAFEIKAKSAAINVVNPVLSDIPAVSKMGAVYLTLINSSNEDVHLLSADSEVAKHLMIHQSVNDNGVAKMHHQESLLIPKKGKVVFKPGGLHIMLMGIDKSKLSSPFDIQLTFKNHPPLIFTVGVGENQ